MQRTTHPAPPHLLRRIGRGRRGMAMALTMLVLLGALAVLLLGALSSGPGTAARGGSGVMTVTDGGRQMAAARMQSAAAAGLAEMGGEYTLQWLNSLTAPPSGTRAFAPSFTWGDTSVSPPPAATLGAQNRITRSVVAPDPSHPGATFSVIIYPDMSNTGSTTKKYLIESVGSDGGTPVVLQTYVQEASFGKYAIFINDTPPNSYWASGSNVFDGPVHSNNQVNASNNQANLNNVLWNDGAVSGQPVTPIFTWQGPDAFTVSGPSVNWWRNSPFNTSGPANEAEWQDILSAGSAGFHPNDTVVAFPPDSAYQTAHGQSRQHDVALGNNPPPTASGVTVEPGGGIYIHCASTTNDVQQMTLNKVNFGGAVYQSLDVTQTGDSGSSQKTTLFVDPSHNVYKGFYFNGTLLGMIPAGTGFNGVIYCDGDIGTQGSPQAGGLAGRVCDHTALTIATDPSKNCNIDGDLKYATARQTQGGAPIPEAQDANFVNNAGTLGIVSDNVRIMHYYGSNDWEGNTAGGAITNIEADAAVMAYGTYDAQDYTTRPLGKMLNMGSYLVKTRGIFSLGNSNGVAIAGVPCDRRYDNRLANAPPPSFPTTGNLYSVLSWRRVGQTLAP